MSFFGELVSSIETGKAPPRPVPVQRLPGTTPSINASAKPVPKPQLEAITTNVSNDTLKRKVNNETEDRSAARPVKPMVSTSTVSKNDSQASTPVVGGAKTLSHKPQINNATLASPLPPAKAPPKGSYADIMARAKQAQEQRTQSKVGLIKHQATSKEKVSKLAERRREEQEKLKQAKVSPSKADAVTKAKGKRITSPVKADQTKAPKAPRPPLHAPSTSYKGTMGTSAKRSRDSGAGRAAKRSRYDEYLGTDEDEDDMEGEDDDGYGYGSDESSDMEAGLDDMEQEEAMALRAAKVDDARELALENKLKREKEERRKRLEMMAKKGR